jgi:ectoine hydroxylase-related dioxygenase (phytanoyl-CoA dioxygenase family)
VINILSTEKAQPIHFDDGFYQIPRPRKPLGAATIWALDDFTEENGSTLLNPGSHQWDDRRPDDDDIAKQIKCQMTAGSVVFLLDTTWHGGGANSSIGSRLAVTAQYCEGFCRTQENFLLSVSPERVAACSEDMQRMLGYSVYGPFMGRLWAW